MKQPVTLCAAALLSVRADVADTAAVTRMVEQARAAFGRVDILVNDAAFNQEAPFTDLDGLTHG